MRENIFGEAQRGRLGGGEAFLEAGETVGRFEEKFSPKVNFVSMYDTSGNVERIRILNYL